MSTLARQSTQPKSKVRLHLSGEKFGLLTAIEHLPGDRRNLAKWRCVCDCGRTADVHQYSLRKGITRSCGCLKAGTKAHNHIDLSGQTFGRLTVVKADGRSPAKQTLWLCQCECGGEARTTTTKLRSGHTSSCGCFKSEVTAERSRKDGLFAGGKRHALFDTFSGMLSRCTNENDAAYAGYGGRGIKVCDRWRLGEGGKTGFALFLKDMGPRPTSRHSIDRIDNDGNYEPGNCRWATPQQQARNRRSNRLVPFDDGHVALSEYCERKGLRFAVVNSRLSKGWSIERALSQPVRGGGKIEC